MNFGQAIDALKAGKKVQRQGWSGKGMFLVLDPGSVVNELREGSAYHKAGITGSITINPHIDMKTATGEMQPGWLASQTDVLADDWQVVVLDAVAAVPFPIGSTVQLKSGGPNIGVLGYVAEADGELLLAGGYAEAGGFRAYIVSPPECFVAAVGDEK